MIIGRKIILWLAVLGLVSFAVGFFVTIQRAAPTLEPSLSRPDRDPIEGSLESFDITLLNRTSDDLELVRIHPSCSCMKATALIDKELPVVLLPGGTVIVRVTIDLKNRAGKQTFRVDAHVKHKGVELAPLSAQFEMFVRASLTPLPGHIHLAEVKPGQDIPFSFDLADMLADDQADTIIDVVPSNPARLQAKFRPTTGAREVSGYPAKLRYVVEGVLHTPIDLTSGADSLEVVTSGKYRRTLLVPVTYSCAPILRVFPPRIAFPVVKPGATAERVAECLTTGAGAAPRPTEVPVNLAVDIQPAGAGRYTVKIKCRGDGPAGMHQQSFRLVYKDRSFEIPITYSVE